LKTKNNIEIKNHKLGSIVAFGKDSPILTELGCGTVNDFLFITFFLFKKNILKKLPNSTQRKGNLIKIA